MKKKNLIESAGGVVIRKTEKGFSTILLYKNNHWILPKGRIEKGESKKKTALREVHEETSIPLNKMRIITELGKINYMAHQSTDNYSPRPKIVTYFLIQTSYKKIKPLKTDGFQKASWINLNRVLQKSSFINNKAIILKAIKHLNSKYLNKIDTAVIAVGGKEERMISLNRNSSKLLFLINEQPFLKYLLDIVLKSKFQKIYLLTSYNYREIKSFIKKFYPNSKKIKIFHAGKEGQKKGPVTALYKMKTLIKEPFLYIDGNVIFKPSLLKKISSKCSLKDAVIRLTISPEDIASTHLGISIKNNEIKKTFPRSPSSQNNIIKNHFCSIGVAAIDNKIFDLLPNPDKFYDLDLLTDFIFKTKLNTDINFVDFIKYKEEWYCIHIKKDVELLEKKGGKFLSSLKTK